MKLATWLRSELPDNVYLGETSGDDVEVYLAERDEQAGIGDTGHAQKIETGFELEGTSSGSQ